MMDIDRFTGIVERMGEAAADLGKATADTAKLMYGDAAAAREALELAQILINPHDEAHAELAEVLKAAHARLAKWVVTVEVVSP